MGMKSNPSSTRRKITTPNRPDVNSIKLTLHKTNHHRAKTHHKKTKKNSPAPPHTKIRIFTTQVQHRDGSPASKVQENRPCVPPSAGNGLGYFLQPLFFN